MGSRDFSHAKKIMFVVSFLLSNSVFAEVRTMSDLDVLQQETMYYRALTLKNKAMQDAGVNVQSSVTVTKTADGSVKGLPSLPTVESIMGNSKGMLAKIRYPDNTISNNRVGDVINGNLKITRISLNGVQVKNITSGELFDLKEVMN